MNTGEEILAKLRAGEPFGRIRTGVHSISKLYEAAGQFLDELQSRLENTRAQVSRAEDERAGLQAQVKSLRCEQENLREGNQELEQENMRLESELSEKTVNLTRLQERIDEFRRQGFSAEIMEKLEPMVERGGEKLLRQVESVEVRPSNEGLSLPHEKQGLPVETSSSSEKREKEGSGLCSFSQESDR